MTTASTSSTTDLATALPSDFVQITMNPVTEPFWQAAKERRLVAQQCADCQQFRMPPTPYCPNCQSRAVAWPELSGRAEIYSFAVVHGFPGYPDITMVSAVVDLPDAPGARLVSNVIDVDPATVEIGQQLVVDFHPITEGWMLPVFRMAPDPASTPAPSASTRQQGVHP